MKDNFYQLKLFLLVTLALSLNFSCGKQESINTSSIPDVPELIQRSAKIQQGKEWDYVQNYYSEQKAALTKDKSDQEAKLNLAHLFISEARVTGEHGHYYPAALKMCDEIIQESENNSDILFRVLTTKAGVELSLHEFNRALQTAEKAVVLNDRNAQIFGVLVDAYVELGQYKKAVEMADKMIAIKPDLRSYSRVSYLREIHGDVKGAIKALNLAIDAGYPGYDETAWAMMTLGDLYELYGEQEKAKIVYETILQEREHYPFAIAALGKLALQAGDIVEAKKKTQEAMDIIPEVGFYTQMAEIYQLEGKEKAFDDIMEEIFLMLEDDVQSGHNMNLEYVHIYNDLLNDPEKALEYAKKEYQKRPENIDVNRAYAKVLINQGNNSKALDHLSIAENTQSKHPDLALLRNRI